MADVVVVGSGPNGLAAAVTLARAGLRVLVLEAQTTAGGGARTASLGLADGVVHDICSAVHPMGVASPFFREFDLGARGVELLQPEASYAQPLDGGRAGVAYRDIERTVRSLGIDGAAWRSLLGPLAASPDAVLGAALGDKRSIPAEVLRDLVGTARFGLAVAEQGTPLWNLRFRGDVAPALLTGVAAHAISPIPSLAASGTALLLGSLAHSYGWPIPRGGSGSIIDALVADLVAHGGEVRTGNPVRSGRDLPPARAYVFDTTPRTAADVLQGRLSPRAARMLRSFRYGNAAAKVDFVLDGPVPWANPEVGRAGTVHLGGSRADMARAESDVASGVHAERPMVLLSDPSVVDETRIVGGLRPLWTYAHVPAGSTVDPTEMVTAQIERFAPGFRDVVVASRGIPAAQMSEHNENYVGGDIASGAVTMWQMFARPTPRLDPYATGVPGAYLCSSSTPPGPGVHGLGGWYAARHVLRDRFGVRDLPSLAP
ncbi:NAD(P)/FAD-dependent oxidoreductase [Sanguibacter sp. 25GB23B1]|uniref:phytoene desaturase family protein n=1 Tax=unclassified Sanguibacter TaxID=2645534 RepID=UPI0032B02372